MTDYGYGAYRRTPPQEVRCQGEISRPWFVAERFKQCHRKAKPGTKFCWQHRGQARAPA